METFYKKWRQFLNEELSDEQNEQIKNLYLIIREFTLEAIKQYKSFLESKNKILGPGSLGTFFREVKIQSSLGRSHPSSFGYYILNIPDSIRSVLTNLSEDFSVSFRASQGEAGLARYKNTVSYIEFNLLDFIKKERLTKARIHHELQHIIDVGTDHDFGVEGSKEEQLRHDYTYYANPGEIKAHGKEYAYLIYKMYPNIEYIDNEVLKKLYEEAYLAEEDSKTLGQIVKYKDIRKINNERNFNLSEELMSMLEKLNKDIIDTANYFLPFYRKK